MMPIAKVLQRERLCRAMTGLTPQEFQTLVPAFGQALARQAWDAYRADWRRTR